MTVPVACRYTVEVQATPERVPQIRRIIAAHLRYWDLEAHIRPVCGAVAELVGNVAQHVTEDKTCVVELRFTGRHLIASVADKGRRLPRLLSSSPSRGGLARVAALSDSWGTCGTATGKVIWFSRRVKTAQRVPSVPVAPIPQVPAFAPSAETAREREPAVPVAAGFPVLTAQGAPTPCRA
ncbi:ATP-binding protein [Streptomyces sp. A3M-1-3]|uniref:ATP-binding protein n=1 Tax=Streptomyces sp. A3M-1-3 TaxID=2962044 RepID=UPI0020B748A5|nr:ATP-binding protein [Streptomyces sp. A3M-1-3]MCP3820004.1 ATP-binding protein [Streptomyces sp. A3M-1-3]